VHRDDVVSALVLLANVALANAALMDKTIASTGDCDRPDTGFHVGSQTLVSHLPWRKNSGERQRSIYTNVRKNAFKANICFRKADAALSKLCRGLSGFIS